MSQKIVMSPKSERQVTFFWLGYSLVQVNRQSGRIYSSSISCFDAVVLFEDIIAARRLKSSDRFFALIEVDLLPLNDSLVGGAECG